MKRAKRFRWRVNAEDEVIAMVTGTLPLNSLSTTDSLTDTGQELRVAQLNINNKSAQNGHAPVPDKELQRLSYKKIYHS